MTKLLSDPENVHSADVHGLRQALDRWRKGFRASAPCFAATCSADASTVSSRLPRRANRLSRPIPSSDLWGPGENWGLSVSGRDNSINGSRKVGDVP